MRKGGYLFLSGFSSLYDCIHGWMTGQMDGWMKKASRKTNTTSFTICNIQQWCSQYVTLQKYFSPPSFNLFTFFQPHP
jgi:nitrate reductase alpha subunit